MFFKKSIEEITVRSVVVEADSFEEAQELFEDGDWYDEDAGDGEPMYFIAETEEDADNDEWEMIDEED